jgi:Phosphoesterase family
MAGQGRDHALDHVVVVVFENRSLDNVLGRLYGPGDGKTFDGVIGKDLTNPIPEWAEHGADRKVVPYTVATDMDSPNPDTGEEYPHTNTQLYGILSEANRFKLGEEIAAPYNAPEPGQEPTMDGFVTDYISTLTAELGRQPTYEEYSQVMTGFTPEQIPVLSALARGFGVFDHWFCEVPSQTFTNRSFWTAATASGFVVNQPVKNWLAGNTAETIFNRLEQHGKTWKVYVGEPDRFSATGLIHYPRLKDRFATHFVPFAQFEADAAAGDLPDFSYIEPCLILGHGDYHPAAARALGHGIVIPGLDPPSSILGGEAFLAQIYHAYQGMQSPAGSSIWNTTLLIGWDEPGGTYDHVPPGPVPSPDPSAPRRPARVHLRPLRLPGPCHPGVPVGSRRPGVQPGAPAQFPDRHPAGAVGARRPAHRPRRRRPDVLARLHPRHSARPPHLARAGPAPGAPLRPGRTRPRQDHIGHRQDRLQRDTCIRRAKQHSDRGTARRSRGRDPPRTGTPRHPQLPRHPIPPAAPRRPGTRNLTPI